MIACAILNLYRVLRLLVTTSRDKGAFIESLFQRGVLISID